jgi:hypothetical protein
LRRIYHIGNILPKNKFVKENFMFGRKFSDLPNYAPPGFPRAGAGRGSPPPSGTGHDLEVIAGATNAQKSNLNIFRFVVSMSLAFRPAYGRRLKAGSCGQHQNKRLFERERRGFFVKNPCISCSKKLEIL